MAMTPPPFEARLLAPRHWPAWAGLGVAWLLAHLPWSLQRAVGRSLGWLFAHLPGSRRRVAARNLALAFPDLSPAEREKLLRRNLADAGMMLVEFAFAWMGSRRKLARVPVRLEGLEHLEAARAAGRGVLLVGGHFSHLELCARLVSQAIPIAGMYRLHKDAAFEWAILRARLGYGTAMFGKDALRPAIRYLRGGGTLWYAPDQDMRGKDAVFVPFFGVPAATITATHHLARLSGADVIPFEHRREADGSYHIRLLAPLEDFPGADAAADTARVNAAIEAMVRKAPAQYLWMHKRFKTRPDGEPDLYRA